jgi:hypothetical protein
MIGWRFKVTAATVVTQVGGHLGGISGQIFAAITRLPELDSLPQGAPFDDDEVVASAKLTPPAVTADVRVPINALLSPGSYALVFGSGQFGATGSGFIPYGQQTNIEPTMRSSYISWRQTLPEQFAWTSGGPNTVRFVVVGSEVAGPTDFTSDGLIDAQDLAVWRNNFGPGKVGGILVGDSDLDGDADGGDLLAWQRTLGQTFTPPPAAVAAPEPATLALALTAAVCGRLLARRSGRRE